MKRFVDYGCEVEPDPNKFRCEYQDWWYTHSKNYAKSQLCAGWEKIHLCAEWVNDLFGRAQDEWHPDHYKANSGFADDWSCQQLLQDGADNGPAPKEAPQDDASDTLEDQLDYEKPLPSYVRPGTYKEDSAAHNNETPMEYMPENKQAMWNDYTVEAPGDGMEEEAQAEAWTVKVEPHKYTYIPVTRMEEDPSNPMPNIPAAWKVQCEPVQNDDIYEDVYEDEDGQNDVENYQETMDTTDMTQMKKEAMDQIGEPMAWGYGEVFDLQPLESIKSGWMNRAALLLALYKANRMKYFEQVVEQFCKEPEVRLNFLKLRSSINKYGDYGPYMLGYKW